MASDYPFRTPLPHLSDDTRPDVLFTCTPDPPGGVDWRSAEVIDAQGTRPDGEPDFVFFRFPSHDMVRITGAVDFHLYDDRIVGHLRDRRHSYLVEIALLGMIFAFWLERRGTACLHASAVTIDGLAVAFLANKGAGKTSTAAACLAQGHELLSDDLLALNETGNFVVAHRGFPALRLWPAQANHFIGDFDLLPVVHPDFPKRLVEISTGGFGSFAPGPAPVRRLYLPERHSDSSSCVRVEELSPEDSVMALLRHSFLPREVHVFGWQVPRLQIFSRLVHQTPVRRLTYPSGFLRLPKVVAAIEEDIGHGGR